MWATLRSRRVFHLNADKARQLKEREHAWQNNISFHSPALKLNTWHNIFVIMSLFRISVLALSTQDVFKTSSFTRVSLDTGSPVWRTWTFFLRVSALVPCHNRSIHYFTFDFHLEISISSIVIGSTSKFFSHLQANAWSKVAWQHRRLWFAESFQETTHGKRGGVKLCKSRVQFLAVKEKDFHIL